MDKLGIVYFVRAGNSGFVKIGWTSDLKGRLACLQTSHPLKLKPILTLPGNIGREHSLHWRFREDRADGEWFRLSDNLRRFIRAHGGTAPPPSDYLQRNSDPSDDEVRAGLALSDTRTSA